jgi:hypothetical protein
MGTYGSFHFHVLWVRHDYLATTEPLSLTRLVQASYKYHRFFNAHPWWFCDGKQFNRHEYHCRVLPYPSWCCHLRRRGWHASNVALRLVSPPWVGTVYDLG